MMAGTRHGSAEPQASRQEGTMAASESIKGGGGFHMPVNVRMERRLTQPKWSRRPRPSAQ